MEERREGPDASESMILLERARGGDRAAAEELFHRLIPKVERIVALRMGRRISELWDQDDVVQETLKDAYKGLGSFEMRHEGALCHWLATLVHNNLLDHQRRQRAAKRDGKRVAPPTGSSTPLAASVFGHDSTTPSRIAEAAELEERIEQALLSLDERQRRVIELRKLCDLSFEEIAAELGLTQASSARALYSRAMSALAERI